MRVGIIVRNTVKGGGMKKKEGETKILKRGGGGQAGAGALKSEGLEPPYEL